MRKRRAGKIAALVGLGLAMSVAPAQAQSYKPEPVMPGKPWDGLFGGGTPKPEVMEPVGPVQPLKEEKSVGTVTGRAREQERLMKVYLRREAVADRIRDVGVATNNAALVEDAAYLREKAWQIYVKNSGRLLGTLVPLGADDMHTDKPVHSAAALSQASEGPDAPATSRDGGRTATNSSRQTSVTREGDR
jgi:hypothetical protein